MITHRLPYALDQCALYKVTSPKMLVARLSVASLQYSVEELEALANGVNNYSVRIQQQAGRKARKIEEPKPRLQKLHGRVHALLSRVDLPDYVQSARRGRSYVTNARAHVGRGELIKVDLKSFYRSAKRAAVAGFFEHQMKCASDVAGLLARLLTFDGHLPTGSRSSPLVSYFAYSRMFDEIAAYAESRGLVATLYVDDIAVSGTGANRGTINVIRRIVSKYGLQAHKIRQFRQHRSKVVTGVVVGAETIRLPNRRHERIRDGYNALHSAVSQEEKLKLLPRLTSLLHEAAQIEPVFQQRADSLVQLRRKLESNAVLS